MEFKGHMLGGIIAGAAVASAAYFVGEKAGLPLLGADKERQIAAGFIFLTGVFFSIYPDFDRPTDMRSWFYRLLFVGLLTLVFQHEYELVGLVAIIAIIPILGYEQSSSHSWVSVILYPAFILIVYKTSPITSDFSTSWQVQQIIDLFVDQFWWWLACMMGWASHLILDCEKLLFIENDKDHY
ncbi:MAG: metal-dependent hydrolase [Mariprofundaceae bacterium]|nr:metal-dependent hydrolase [Mariprofundaceae bacterium]